jgi:hypothetical protein
VPLVFSPLSEALLDLPPKKLFPKYAFVMRQLGDPPAIDRAMNAEVGRLFRVKGFAAMVRMVLQAARITLSGF